MNSQTPPYEVTSDDKLWAALAYFFSPIAPIIILLMQDKKDRPFIKAPNIQALVTGIVLGVLVNIIGVVTLGCGYLAWFLMLIPALKAYQGQLVEIPVITNFVKQQGWA
jgi:uncharacterized protein